RQLEGDVRLEALGCDPAQNLLVGLDDAVRRLAVGDSLAEQRRVRSQTLLVQPAQRDDRLVERLAGNEPRSAEPHPVPVGEAPDPWAVRRGEDDATEHYTSAACSQGARPASSSSRSACVRPRSGARTSSWIATPRWTRTCLSAAWRGHRPMWMRRS